MLTFFRHRLWPSNPVSDLQQVRAVSQTPHVCGPETSPGSVGSLFAVGAICLEVLGVMPVAKMSFCVLVCFLWVPEPPLTQLPFELSLYAAW